MQPRRLTVRSSALLGCTLSLSGLPVNPDLSKYLSRTQRTARLKLLHPLQIDAIDRTRLVSGQKTRIDQEPSYRYMIDSKRCTERLKPALQLLVHFTLAIDP